MNKTTISVDIVSSTELTLCALSQLQIEIKTFVKHLGNYFVTICTKDRQHYFGEISDKQKYRRDH